MSSYRKHIFSFEDAKDLDSYAQELTKVNGIQWMGWAAISIFQVCRNLFLKYQEIIILCGSGNNGGDGYALAYFLQTEGQNVRIFYTDSPRTQESLYYYNLLKVTKVSLAELVDLKNYLTNFEKSFLIIDCLYGIGARLPLPNAIAKILIELNSWKRNKTKEICHFLSIDAITGREAWMEWISNLDKKENMPFFPADTLIEIGSSKWENFGFPDENKITIPIGFPRKEFIEDKRTKLVIQELEILPKDHILKILRKPKISHKYKAGSCLFVGAEKGMEGAILLSLSSFHGIGGGISKVNSLSKEIWNHKEAMNPSYMVDTDPVHFWQDSFFKKASGLVWGPGTLVPALENNEALEEWKQIRNFPEKYFILDAGRIPSFNLIDKNPDLSFHPNCILTAHFGEFNRLTNCGNLNWEDRISSGLQFSKKLNAYILLKESYSLLFSPSGEFYIWNEPNEKLATMGTGDLLTGILALYLSRKFSMLDSVHFALNTINLCKQMDVRSPTSWEILEFLKKV